MGILLNPSNTAFKGAVNSEIYVDKSELLEFTNRLLGGEQKNICVSRPRRFGKSMTANMLCAYYSRGCRSKELFSPLKIASHKDFEKHLNKYNVIKINIIDYIDRSPTVKEAMNAMTKRLLHELIRENPEADIFDPTDLTGVLEEIFTQTDIPFVFIIDEWDCVFRKKKSEEEIRYYLNFLRSLLKDKPYSALCYMTGILPIKKYGEHSALNMFAEYSMTNSSPIERFTGFTEEETAALCAAYNMDFSEIKKWYDGYTVNGCPVYSPNSVTEAVTRRKIDSYWTSTESYEALKIYIRMNFDGLRDAVTKLLAGESCPIDPGTFTNDMVTFCSGDDVLTLLVHLGYLAFDSLSKTVRIPNFEIAGHFASTVKILGWDEVAKALERSEELLKATLDMNAAKTADHA
ncbi:MAG: AAA family ATPase [Ruminococcus sp.]|nr:AAA family ATPase [Ruminococcus sp.]